jgi:hypothetical protein
MQSSGTCARRMPTTPLYSLVRRPAARPSVAMLCCAADIDSDGTAAVASPLIAPPETYDALFTHKLSCSQSLPVRRYCYWWAASRADTYGTLGRHCAKDSREFQTALYWRVQVRAQQTIEAGRRVGCTYERPYARVLRLAAHVSQTARPYGIQLQHLQQACPPPPHTSQLSPVV